MLSAYNFEYPSFERDFHASATEQKSTFAAAEDAWWQRTCNWFAPRPISSDPRVKYICNVKDKWLFSQTTNNDFLANRPFAPGFRRMGRRTNPDRTVNYYCRGFFLPEQAKFAKMEGGVYAMRLTDACYSSKAYAKSLPLLKRRGRRAICCRDT